MNIIVEHRSIIAETESDKEVLIVLYNARLIPGTYLIWTNRNNKPFPDNYSHLLKGIDYIPTAFVILNEDIDVTPTQEVAKARIEKEIKEADEADKNKASELFSFLQ